MANDIINDVNVKHYSEECEQCILNDEQNVNAGQGWLQYWFGELGAGRMVESRYEMHNRQEKMLRHILEMIIGFGHD